MLRAAPRRPSRGAHGWAEGEGPGGFHVKPSEVLCRGGSRSAARSVGGLRSWRASMPWRRSWARSGGGRRCVSWRGWSAGGGLERKRRRTSSWDARSRSVGRSGLEPGPAPSPPVAHRNRGRLAHAHFDAGVTASGASSTGAASPRLDRRPHTHWGLRSLATEQPGRVPTRGGEGARAVPTVRRTAGLTFHVKHRRRRPWAGASWRTTSSSSPLAFVPAAAVFRRA